MVFGQAKVALNEKGYGLQTAVPSVVSGRDHGIQGIGAGPRIRVPFETDAGPFFIEICLSDEADSAAREPAA
jgi:chemotaxis protein CheX